jgi:TolB protein
MNAIAARNGLGIAALLFGLVGTAFGQPAGQNEPGKELSLRDPIQLTSRDRFVKAGEAYFSPDGRWIIFQAVPVPSPGKEPSPFYSMYVAKLKRPENSKGVLGPIMGIEPPILVSPEGSANTCGWFHPTQFGRVIFGSTMVAPTAPDKPGFQVGSNKYVWSFPPEMEIVKRTIEPVFEEEFERRSAVALKNGLAIDRAKDLDVSIEPVFSRLGYDAECSYSSDGRYLLHANVDPKKGETKPDADIWAFDTTTNSQIPLIEAKGYDGGPFFSPDGKWICYRSDRRGDDKLQIFVAKLKFENDALVGVEREFQLTDDENVNWAPYWHPSGRFLVFGSSAVGHSNYEVFSIRVDEAALERGEKPAAAERVTFTAGADVLPAFSADGAWMMWTSQRGPLMTGEQKPSSQLWISRWVGDSAPATDSHE